MRTPNLTFNLVTFIHPAEQYTFFFTKDETEGLCRIYHKLVPDVQLQECHHCHIS
jgi:hypothetical protein